MIHFDPAAIEPAGTVILAAETGVAMKLGNKKQAEAAATPAPPPPTPVNVTVNGITGADYLMGMLILAGALLVLAAAVLVTGAVIHHGLTT